MNQATIGRRTYQVPGRFSELQPRQLSAVVGLLHSGRPLVEVRLRILLVLLQVKRRPWLAFLLWFRVSAEQRYLLLQLTQFAFNEPKLYEQRLPVLRAGRWWWPRLLYGPASSFANLSFAEFIDCEVQVAAYGRTRNVADLDKLVASLYRPHGGKAATPADARQTYDAHTVAQRLPAVARLPLATKLAVRMWYTSCRLAWAKKYAGTIFHKEAGAGPRTAGDPREVWNEILAVSAGGPDRYDLYGRLVLPNVLYDLDRRMQALQKKLDEAQSKR